jgi:hypothetical protein
VADPNVAEIDQPDLDRDLGRGGGSIRAWQHERAHAPPAWQIANPLWLEALSDYCASWLFGCGHNWESSASQHDGPAKGGPSHRLRFAGSCSGG